SFRSSQPAGNYFQGNGSIPSLRWRSPECPSPATMKAAAAPIFVRNTSHATKKSTLQRLHFPVHHAVPSLQEAPPTRVAQACVPCHRTKTRCDGQQPTCSTCNDKGKSCEWPQPRGGSKSLTDRSSSSPSSSSGLPTSGCTPPSNSMALPDHGGHPMTAPSMQHQHQHPHHPPTGMTTTSHAMMSAGPMPMTTMSDTLDFTTPGSILDEAMRLQLQSIYFAKFHPQWPLLHRETFETTAQPKLLMQAVMTVGLWFASWPDARGLAIKFHDSLLVETGNKLLDLLEQSRQGMLSPRMDLLPVFQSMLISTILVPYRADQSMDNVMMTHSMLLETFKATGVYEQSKINLGSQLCGHSGYPWIFKELYQRLAVFQFKLHLILQTIFITIHPALRLSRNAEPGMLRIKIPLPLMMWDGPAAHWYGMVPTDPALLDANTGDEEVLMISKMCEKASLTMDNKALVPLLSWDRCLGMAIWCWCLRGSETDKEFIENVKPFVLDPLKDTNVFPGSG
ncbi:early growth response protein 1 is a zinc-finger protein, partial [Colletotrichum filicis]